MYFHAKNK